MNNLFPCDCESDIIAYVGNTILYACERNMNLALNKLEEDFYLVCKVSDKLIEANLGKSQFSAISENVWQINLGGNTLISSKHKWEIS